MTVGVSILYGICCFTTPTFQGVENEMLKKMGAGGLYFLYVEITEKDLSAEFLTAKMILCYVDSF